MEEMDISNVVFFEPLGCYDEEKELEELVTSSGEASADAMAAG
jgi:hypothetical protein